MILLCVRSLMDVNKRMDTRVLLSSPWRNLSCLHALFIRVVYPCIIACVRMDVINCVCYIWFPFSSLQLFFCNKFLKSFALTLAALL